MKKTSLVTKPFIEYLQETLMDDEYGDGVLMFDAVMELMGVNPEDYLEK